MSKKGENIYKRKDGRWEARYKKGYLENGKISYGYCYAKTYRDAKKKAEEANIKLALGIATEKLKEKKTLSVFCDEWLQLKRSKVKAATMVKYSSNIENHIKPHLGGFELGSLNTLVIEQFSHELLFDENLSAKTVTDILSQLKSILKYTSKQNRNMPAVEVVYPKYIKKKFVYSLKMSKKDS